MLINQPNCKHTLTHTYTGARALTHISQSQCYGMQSAKQVFKLLNTITSCNV